nr:hypothetical protein [Tanacetum cinerariifolium]
MTESPLVDSCLSVLVSSLGDDPIACLIKAMAFLIDVASSRFPSTNNQLRNFLNLRNQATIQDGKIEDLDTYDSDCDDVSNAKVVLVANISNYGSDVISKRIKPTLYDGIVISNKHVAMPMIDDEETLIMKEETFVPQQELSADEVFWYHMLNPSTKSSDALPVKIEAPKELPKVILGYPGINVVGLSLTAAGSRLMQLSKIDTGAEETKGITLRDDNRDGDQPETSNPSPLVPPLTQQIPHTVLSIKLPIQKKREYDIWAMKMEHYLSHTDYLIWQVIQNGNGFISVTTDTNGMIKVLPPKTAEKVVAREMERKARTILLMALPEDHLAKFHKKADAKEMWEAIKSRFGSNDESKKMQKYLLKQQFEVFYVYASEGGQEESCSLILRIHLVLIRPKWNASIAIKWDILLETAELKGTKIAEQEMLGTMETKLETTSGHVEEDTHNYAMMAYSSSNSGSDNEVKSCSKTCEESYARLKKLYDEQIDKLGDASVEITTYTLALKRLLNIRMSANDKFGLGYGDYRYGSILSYENEVLQSVFMNKECDLEDTPVNDRYAEGMHAVPPPMTGNYMPSGPDVEIDYSKFTYDPKQTSVDESDAKPCENASCESDSSVQTSTSMLEPVDNAPKIVCKPKVWTDAPIIEEYESDSDDDSVENVKETGTPNHSPKVVKQDRNVTLEGVWVMLLLEKHALFVGNWDTAVKAFADDPHRALKDKGIVDSGCSRHMTGNNAHLADYQEFKVALLPLEDETIPILKDFIRQAENQFNHKVKTIRSNNGTELKNDDLVEFYGLKGIKREYSNARTPQQNEVAERKNRQPIISYLRPFGCHVTIFNTIDQLGKFDGKSTLGFLVGYFLNSKAFRVYNLDTKIVEENLHVNFLENKPNVAGKGHAWMFDLDYLTNSMNYEPVSVENQDNKSAVPKEANNSAGEKIEKTTDVKTCEKPNANTNSTNLLNVVSIPISTAGPSRVQNDDEPLYLDDPSMPHLEDIYASPSEGIFTDSSYDDEGVVTDFNSLETTVKTRSKVNKNSEAHALKAIGTKWVCRNKKDKKGVVVRNKARLVAQGHRQEERIDYDESAFLYGKINEEVYVTQPLGFVDPKFPNKVYKVVKALYGLHQALRAWYATLSTFLDKSGYRRGAIDKTLFINVKTASTPIETQNPLVKDEAIDVDVHLYRSMIGSLMYLTASRPGIMFAVCACSRFQITPKTSHLQAVKRIFRRLISWQCKNQTIMATSTIKAEYVAAAHCCGQVLWIQNQLKELASPKQMALGKDESNPLIVNSLLKTIWLSMHHVIAMKHWLFQSKWLLNEFSCSMASAVICLATGRNFNFSKYIFDNMVRNVDSPIYIPCTYPKVFGNMRRVGKGFSRVETPLFATMLAQPQSPAAEEEDELEEASAVEPTMFDDEEVTITMAQTLIKMKAKKARLLDEQMAKRLHDEEVEQAAAREKQEKDDLEKAKVYNTTQARKNLIAYLKNMVGYKMEHFKEEPTKKRVAKKTLLQESFKKLKAVKVSGSHSTQDTPTDDPKEMSEEDVKNMLKIILVFKFKVEALQVKLVKERFSSTVPTVDKKKALWEELTRLFEPNAADVFWKLQRYMHDPLKWKLYTNCRVHQVSSTRRYDIFMLTKKDYPLSDVVMILMLSAKLQVDEDCEMARDLVMKIFMKANKPKNRSLDISSK